MRRLLIWHRNLRTILLKQAVNPVLPLSTALVAHEAHHLLFGRSLTERIRTVGHRHNQLSHRSARSICAVALSMSASSPLRTEGRRIVDNHWSDFLSCGAAEEPRLGAIE